ncbi:sigma factor-like helix-turn-helix DNA-binding protein [Nocardia gamkensis]|uniref:sigma factor-like helix-turn-helix DNA-binding protein n=1 Tax=Nocardia gamkensis TaxID=352869 RepID=UPI0037CA4886
MFVLREVLGIGYDEIATAVDKSPTTVRQIAHRARKHIDARRPRSAVSAAETQAVLDPFRRALQSGDPRALLDVLAPDVVLVSDGGGIKRAALRPITGAGNVVRYILGGIGRTEATVTIDPTVINGSPVLLFRLDSEIDGIMAIRVHDGRINGLYFVYFVRNPHKLTRVETETPLTLR